MTKKEELTKQKEALQQAITNILEAGQEFQTRNGRVRQADLAQLQKQLALVESQLAELNGGGRSMTTRLVYGGCR